MRLLFRCFFISLKKYCKKCRKLFFLYSQFYPEQINNVQQEILSEWDWHLVNKQTSRLNNETTEFNELNGTKETAEDILKLIRLLYQLNESRDKISQTENLFSDFNSPFISKHLSRKLTRQLDDNLASIAGPAFSDWCFNLPQIMPYLFPFELRKKLLKICAFGPGRYISSNYYL